MFMEMFGVERLTRALHLNFNFCLRSQERAGGFSDKLYLVLREKFAMKNCLRCNFVVCLCILKPSFKLRQVNNFWALRAKEIPFNDTSLQIILNSFLSHSTNFLAKINFYCHVVKTVKSQDDLISGLHPKKQNTFYSRRLSAILRVCENEEDGPKYFLRVFFHHRNLPLIDCA